VIDKKAHNVVAVDAFASLPLVGISQFIELIQLRLGEIKRSFVKLGCNRSMLCAANEPDRFYPVLQYREKSAGI